MTLSYSLSVGSFLDIEYHGGHILAPKDWDKAESYLSKTTEGGACKDRGLFHIFVR